MTLTHDVWLTVRFTEHAEAVNVLCVLRLSRMRVRQVVLPPAQNERGRVNWARLVGNDSLAEALISHYSAIFEFDRLEQGARESASEEEFS